MLPVAVYVPASPIFEVILSCFLRAGADVEVYAIACQMYRNSGGNTITTIAAHPA